MTKTTDEMPKTDLLAIPNGGQHPSPRAIWAERRRFMEAQKAQFGSDGARVT
jgi:hypothetical protein